MVDTARLDALDRETRAFVDGLIEQLRWKDVKIDKLMHELAVIRRLQFGRRSEQLSSGQASLLDEEIDADLAGVEDEIEALREPPVTPDTRKQPKRQPLPAHLPRIEIRHEPDSDLCACGCRLKRIGEDVAEKLDYTPGVFTVERHVRGKWACATCQTITMAPVPAHVIDKGIPTAGTLAQVLVAKYADHLPLYRQEGIFARAGLALARSTLSQWVGSCGVQLQPLADAMRTMVLMQPVLHADETPIAMLSPGAGKTHRAYLWAYASTQYSDLKAVLYDFAPSRAGFHARNWLGDWCGTLVCDDFSGYKASFEQNGVTEAGCLAHARRKFYELHVKHDSPVAKEALLWFGRLYEVEREVADLDAEQRYRIRQEKSQPIADGLRRWLVLHKQNVSVGTATAKAIDYSLRRWSALTHYIDHADVPADNNWVENQIRPWALGRSNWLFAGSLRAGQRAATIMSLIQSAKMNGHDPYAYLKDVLARLPTQRADRIDELLPNRWTPAASHH